jgi:hypothetical protein
MSGLKQRAAGAPPSGEPAGGNNRRLLPVEPLEGAPALVGGWLLDGGPALWGSGARSGPPG